MFSTAPRPDWFLAQLKPNCAAVAVRNLGRQGFRTFLPMEEVTSIRNNRFISVTRPLFPGYVFVEFGATQGHWRSINSTEGVTRLVSFGGKPAAIPYELISQLKLRCDEKNRLIPERQPVPGEKVTVIRGPFAQFVAQVESITADQRVWVLIDLLGKQTRMAVGAEQLRAI